MTRRIVARDFALETPMEFNQAWEKLDLFPDDLVTRLGNIRSMLRTIAKSIEIWGGKQEWTYNWLNKPDELKKLDRILADLERLCKEAVEMLRAEMGLN